MIIHTGMHKHIWQTEFSLDWATLMMMHTNKKLTIYSIIIFTFLIIFNLSLEAQTKNRKSDSASGKMKWAPGELLVGFKTHASAMQKSSAHHSIGASIVKKYDSISVHRVKIPKELSLDAARKKYLYSPGVRFAEPNYIIKIPTIESAGQKVSNSTIPNDPELANLWGLHNTGQNGGSPDRDIDAPEAWDITTGSENVVVAVIDTGVDYSHPDLAANMWTNTAELNGTPGVDDDGNGFVDDIYGYDFANDDGDPMDDHYHGTHVAGTIAAVGNNGLGITGVAWTARIMALKFLAADGTGLTSDAVSCIEYATQMGAHLTNNSWGGGAYSQTLKDAIDANGRLFVAAAGNDDLNNDLNPHYPSSYESPNILAVLSTDSNDNRASTSCYGKTSVDVAAPGVGIYSTSPGNSYRYLSGTSMATPHVSGLAVLLLAQDASLSTNELKAKILLSGEHRISLEHLCITEKRINAYNALNYTATTGSLRVDITPSEAVSDGARWTYDVAGQWYESGETATDVPTGERVIRFSDVTDWSTPASATVTVNDGQLATASGEYSLIWPGPDAYGYQGYITASETFEDIASTGTSLSFSDIDEGRATAPIGFDFNFYGQNYSDVYVFVNGIISFDADSETGYEIKPLPSYASPSLCIAPWWSDLMLLGDNYVKYQVLGSAPNRRLIVQWEITDYNIENSNNLIKFQIKLYENSGNIVFAYDDVSFDDPEFDNGKLASIGIQSSNGNTGLQYSYLGSRELSTDFSIAFTTGAINTGSLQVNIDPQEAVDAGARWSHNLTSQWFESGETVSNIHTENITIEFKDLNGWQKPASVPTSIQAGQTTTESGTYTYIPNGCIKVDISPFEAVSAGAMWKIVGTDNWQYHASTLQYLPAGSYDITFKNIPFWIEPANISVEVLDGQIVEEEGVYTAAPTGTLTVDLGPSAAVDAGAAWTWLPEPVDPGAFKEDIHWYDSGETTTVEAGDIRIFYKPLLGWAEPAEQRITIAEGASENVTADYNISNTKNLWPGPEAYGYTGELSAAGFEDISTTGTNISFYDSDDAVEEISIGFKFPFYPQSSADSAAGRLQEFEKIYVSTNGYLCINEYEDYTNRPLPNSIAPRLIIAPYWDDLILQGSDSVKYELRGTTPERRLIIQWKIHNLSDETKPGEFQAILYESGKIEFHYKDVIFNDSGSEYNNGGSATIGIQDASAVTGLQYNFNGSTAVNNDDSLIITRQENRESSLTVNFTPAEVQGNAQWRLQDWHGTWQSHGETIENLFAGSEAKITFNDIDNYVSPDEQTVTLNPGANTVNAEYTRAGYLTVTLLPEGMHQAGALWRLAGTTNWRISGQIEKLKPGDYVVEFYDMDFYDEPPQQNVTIVADNTTSIEVTFTAHKGSVKVNLAPQAAVDAGAQWRLYRFTGWQDSGVTVDDILARDHYLEFKPVPGFTAPTGQNVNMTRDTLNEFGPYTYTPFAVVTSVAGYSALTGQQITVDIHINHADGISLYNLNLNFDSRYLTYVGPVGRGDRLDGNCLQGGTLEGPDTLRINGFSDNSFLIPGAGTLARVTFQVAADAPDGTVVPLTLTNLTDDLSISGVSNGSITISLDCADSYDVNGDGSVTPGDALMVLKHYLGTEPLTDACELLKADANNDDQITPGDALIILQVYLGIY